MLFILVNCVRSVYCEMEMVQAAALRTQMAQIRSQAFRHAGHLEMVLEQAPDQGNWDVLRSQPWFAKSWQRNESTTSRRQYTAIIDPRGTIVMHSQGDLIGQQLGRDWYEALVPEAGTDVVRLRNSPLAMNKSAFDLRIPLLVNGKEIGTYHEGLDAGWLEREIATMQREVLIRNLWVMILALIVIVVAAAALRAILKHESELTRLVLGGIQDRSTQLLRIAGGVAHEIRNPLHALRLNLHVVRRSLSGRMPLSTGDLALTLNESDEEIIRLEGLMRDLLRYASPNNSELAQVNLIQELQAAVNLMHEDLQRRQIELRTRFPAAPITVSIDPIRLRQLVENLLVYARNNAGTRGCIELSVVPQGEEVVVEVTDSGPPLSEDQRARIFEPFQAIKETGSGLGLALVQRFAEDAGGSAACESRSPRGNRFRVILPVFTTMLKA